MLQDVLSVAFSADNRQIVSGSRDKTIKVSCFFDKLSCDGVTGLVVVRITSFHGDMDGLILGLVSFTILIPSLGAL